MGKNSVIKSLGKCIGNVAMHKLLFIHTNKPESKNHLNYEIIEYSTDAFEKAQEYNWNEDDKIEIREKAVERVKNLKKHYNDVDFNDDEMENSVEEVMNEVLD